MVGQLPQCTGPPPPCVAKLHRSRRFSAATARASQPALQGYDNAALAGFRPADPEDACPGKRSHGRALGSAGKCHASYIVLHAGGRSGSGFSGRFRHEGFRRAGQLPPQVIDVEQEQRFGVDTSKVSNTRVCQPSVSMGFASTSLAKNPASLGIPRKSSTAIIMSMWETSITCATSLANSSSPASRRAQNRGDALRNASVFSFVKCALALKPSYK